MKKLNLRDRLFIIVFYSNTKPGKVFDIVLLVAILLSVLAVILESVPYLGRNYLLLFQSIEWSFTILFSMEYLLRIYISRKPLKYIFSFWGIVDFFAIIPTYLALIIAGSQYMIVIRLVRLLRVFRILKMARYTREAGVLINAMKASLYKITLFILVVLVLVLMLGTLMYVVEGQQEGFNSIPLSIYWAIVTITTVGYGDLVPQTVMGKFISSIIMLIGYAIIAVPTGIVTVELSKKSSTANICYDCGTANADTAVFCNQCGKKLKDYESKT